MPKYKVTDPSTGRTITLTGDSPPTEQELEQIFASNTPVRTQPRPAPQPTSPQLPTREAVVAQQVVEGLKGAAKGVGSTAVNLGRLVHQIPGVSSAVDSLYGAFGVDVDSAKDFGLKGPGLSDLVTNNTQPQATAEGRLGLTPSNTAQKVGFVAEQAAEHIAPAAKALGIVKAAPVLRAAPKVLQRSIAEGVAAVPTAMAQGQSKEGAALQGAVASTVPVIGSVIGKTARGLMKAAARPTREALEINPNIAQDLLDANINLTEKGLDRAKHLTDIAKQRSDDMVAKLESDPERFLATPQGGVFSTKKASLLGEVVDPVFNSHKSIKDPSVPNALGKLSKRLDDEGENVAMRKVESIIRKHEGQGPNPTLTPTRLLEAKRAYGESARKVFGDTPETSLSKQFDADIHNAADAALGRRIGPEWSAANKETQRNLVNQQVVEDVLGKANAESHMPSPYDQFLLMRGVAKGDPLSVGIALAREAGRFRHVLGGSAHVLDSLAKRGAPTSLAATRAGGAATVLDKRETNDKKAGKRSKSQVSKNDVDALWESYQDTYRK